MANWNLPALSTPLVDAVQQYKDRDVDSAQMFDFGSPTSIPENAIRFNVASGVFQRREGGAWVTKVLTSAALGDISAALNDIITAGTTGTNILIPAITVDTKGRVTALGTNSVRAASTTQTGVVQLNNTVSSSSLIEAGTANSVRTAYNIGATANSKANPLVISENTTNSASSSGHTHAITGFLETGNYLQEIADAGAAAKSTARSNLGVELETVDVELGGDFSSFNDTMRFSLVNGMVIASSVSTDIFSTTSGTGKTSAAGVVPAAFRPGVEMENNYGGNHSIRVSTTGTVVLISEVATSNFGAPNICYNTP